MNGTLQPEVLVLGGTGTVGGGVVAALLEAGSPVLAAGRDDARLQALRARFADEPALETLQGSVADDAAAAALAARVAQRPRPLAAVIASLGSPLKAGRLLDRPASALRRRLQTDLLPHLAAARHLLPLLAEHDTGGRYVLVGGPCGSRPWCAHGDSSVAAAATRMLAQVLHEEAQPLGVRVQLLSVEHPVRVPGRAREACPEWIGALDVGRAAVALLAGRGTPGQIVVSATRQVPAPPLPGLLTGFRLPLFNQEVSP